MFSSFNDFFSWRMASLEIPRELRESLCRVTCAALDSAIERIPVKASVTRAHQLHCPY